MKKEIKKMSINNRTIEIGNLGNYGPEVSVHLLRGKERTAIHAVLKNVKNRVSKPNDAPYLESTIVSLLNELHENLYEKVLTDLQSLRETLENDHDTKLAIEKLKEMIGSLESPRIYVDSIC